MAQGRQVSTGISIPAPVKGWNARDPWAIMPIDEAIQLDNMFPDVNGVTFRKGYETHATGTGSVQTLHSYSYGAFNKLLAFSNSTIWDVTNKAPASVLDNTINSAVWSTVNFGAYAIMVNGVDTPRKFDGTSVTTTVFTGTGLTPENLVGVATFKNRLFFWEANSLAFWYADIQAIAGTLEKFDLSYVASLGGKIVAVGSWSVDAGDGMDDLFVIMLSSGQVLIYQGDDPGDINSWSLTGIYQIGEPINSRGIVKFGGDLVIMTADGYTPLSKGLPIGRLNDVTLISDKISGAVREAVRVNKNSFGWQVIQYPKAGYLMFNVPTSTGDFDQHVMNTRTGAWCRFVNIPSQCWAVHQDKLYFGGVDGVYEADKGQSDNGVEIQFDVRPAFSSMGVNGKLKRWTMVRPVMQISGSIPLSTRLSVDYDSAEPGAAIAASNPPGSYWDVSYWAEDPLHGDFFWAMAAIIRQVWESIQGIGYTASLWMRGKSKTQDITLFSFDYIMEPGGYL